METPSPSTANPTRAAHAGQGMICGQSLSAAMMPIFLAVCFYGFMIYLGGRLLTDPDTLLHIAAGRWIAAHHGIPTTDPFAFTMVNTPWVAHEWAAEVLLAGAYAALGWFGVTALTAAAVAATYFILARFLGSVLRISAALLCVASSFLLAAPRLMARPHVLIMPILVAWTIGLEQARLKGKRPSYFLLPLMTLWANLHGSFVVGLGLLGVYAIEGIIATKGRHARIQTAKRWSIFGGGAVLASLLTPHGVEGPLLALRLSNETFALGFVNEWHSTDFSILQPLEFWLLGFLVLGFALGLRLPVFKLLIILGLVHLALAHRRHTELLALIGPILLAEPLKRAIGDGARVSFVERTPTRSYLAGALVVALITVTAGFFGIDRDHPATAPHDALAAARAAGLYGPVFNAYDFGGYLIFSDIAPFVDGRIDMYGDAFMRDYADAVSAKDDKLSSLLERYHIAWTLLQPGMPAIGFLDRSQGWERVYADTSAVVHRRRAYAP
jgi:hypothetical protein